MREIIFRGRRTDNGEWTAGHYLTRRTKDHGLQHMISVQDMWGFHEVDLETVCQYTGMKDKRGNEVYESDILRSKHGAIGVVQWQPTWGAFCFSIKLHRNDEGVLTRCTGSQNFWNDAGDYEIIGNINENPELLIA